MKFKIGLIRVLEKNRENGEEVIFDRNFLGLMNIYLNILEWNCKIIEIKSIF